MPKTTPAIAVAVAQTTGVAAPKVTARGGSSGSSGSSGSKEKKEKSQS